MRREIHARMIAHEAERSTLHDRPLPPRGELAESIAGEGEGERGLFRGCVFEPVQNKGLTARDP